MPSSDMPPLNVQELNVLQQEGQILEGLSSDHQEQAAQQFWNPRLATQQPMQPPYMEDATEPVARASAWMGLEWQLPGAVIDHLSNCADAARLPISAVVSAALSAFLYRFNRETFGELGYQVKGRSAPLPCRVQLTPEQTFAEWLECFAQEHKKLNQHPWAAASAIARTLPIQIDCVDALENLNLAVIEPDLEEATLLRFLLPADGRSCRIVYNLSCFHRGAIARIQSQLNIFLGGLVTQPQSPLSHQPLLTANERQQLLVDWTQTTADYEYDCCIHTRFEQQAQQIPDAVAVVYRDQVLTYRALNERANQLAHHLRSLGVQPDGFVGLCVERSLDMVVGLLGILKAGAAYLPLDPTYPPERLALMIEDAQPPVILTQAAVQRQVPQADAALADIALADTALADTALTDITQFSAQRPAPTLGTGSLPLAPKCICLDRDWPAIAQQSTANPDPLAEPHNLAYIIYTSGSTGRPKGVMIEHQALTNFAQASLVDYGIESQDRVLQFASISFDAAAEEIYPCLISGGQLVLRSPEMMSSVPQFLQQCRDYGLTVLDLPTAYWHLMVAELKADPALSLPRSIRIVIIGGEAVNPQRVAQWQQILWRTGSQAQLINTYGPTEATVVATAYKLPLPQAEPDPSVIPTVTIGRALRNVKTYVLDEQQQPLPLGVAGELCIGGAGIARGYLGREELTAERFLVDPFVVQSNEDRAQSSPLFTQPSEGGARLYRTGDLVRYLANGDIEFLGRIDNQVKIRGFRIELGEIEAQLTQQATVQNAAVIVREDKPGQKQLVAYVVPQDKAEFAVAIVRQALAEKLPDYMVPVAFVTLSALPMTPNEKVDRRSLPQPAPEDFQTSNQRFAKPQGPIETRLASLWQSLLGLESVGATDNFFELGGTSLLAVKLFMQIEKQFDRSLQLSNLLQAPTIRALAQLLDPAQDGSSQTVNQDAYTTVVPLQAKGSRPPIFFINSISYAQLFVPYLKADQPFYCLNLFGATPVFSQNLVTLTLEQMAEKFVADMLAVQPVGPYYLGSYCGDTKLAIAIGHQLQSLGHTVAQQTLIDPMWDEPSGFEFHWQNLQRFGVDYAVEKVKNRIRVAREQAVYRSRQTVGKLWDQTGARELDQDLELYAHYTWLCDRDHPAPYRGPVSVISCQELSQAPSPALEQAFLSGFQLREIPGYHHTIFQPPQLTDLVTQFLAAIETQAQSSAEPVGAR